MNKNIRPSLVAAADVRMATGWRVAEAIRGARAARAARTARAAQARPTVAVRTVAAAPESLPDVPHLPHVPDLSHAPDGPDGPVVPGVSPARHPQSEVDHLFGPLSVFAPEVEETLAAARTDLHEVADTTISLSTGHQSSTRRI
ncbi:hypothetical protein [Streptomyces sp. H51]|uniref:hypothetical protein n=1 Tax=Streptomyces sp. H51 TaxID=3111770 RepID=UPI002D77E259|nr:hypothetical protein [Streptomyces sp. H51]